MAGKQGELFPETGASQPQSEATLAPLRKKLQATLALVKSAQTMPWDNMARIINEDNDFRFGVKWLPPAEGAALWAEFDVEMDRLYAIMNEGLDLDYDD